MASKSLEGADFATAFRDALVEYLNEKGLTQAEVAKLLGLGKAGRARINTYCRRSPGKSPAKPDAEILYLLCVRIGFSFEYSGYRISAATLANLPVKPLPDAVKQLAFEFDRQFKLTNEAGAISVTVKRPSGRIEVSLSLDAAAS
jgi:transcriptional regulator with XRE-family HTH domain